MAKTYSISVIPGDGTGPEVVNEGIKVLNAVATKCGFHLEFSNCSLGGDHYLTTGEILPQNQVESLAQSDQRDLRLSTVGQPNSIQRWRVKQTRHRCFNLKFVFP